MPVGRPRLAVPAHGTRERYQHRTEPCRCSRCKAANAGYQAAYRAAAAPTSTPAQRWHQLELDPSSYEYVGRR